MLPRPLTLSAVLLLAFAPAQATRAADAARVKASAVKAAERTAAWLVSQANPDGTFGSPKNPAHTMPGVVGMALHALATWPGKPSAAQAQVMEKAAQYLVSCQMESGAIALKEFGLENYNTSVAVLALKALNDPKYNGVLEKAKKYILTCQFDEEQGYKPDENPQAYGGFGYGKKKRPDLSNTQFSLEALEALGLPKDSPAYKNALLFVKRCQDNTETNPLPAMAGDSTGGFVYLPGEGEFGVAKGRAGKEVPKPYGSMTYAGIKSLIYCGLTLESSELQAAWKWVKNNYSVKEQPGGQGSQGYYYYVVVMAKAFTAAGQKQVDLPDGTKANWAMDLAAHLGTLQNPDGSFANAEARWMESDQVLASAYALIALNLATQALP